MIKVNRDDIEMNGSIIQLMAEVAVVLRSSKKMLDKNYPKELADKLYEGAIEMAKMSREEIREENRKNLKRDLDAFMAGYEETKERTADISKAIDEAVAKETYGGKPLLDPDKFGKRSPVKTIEFGKFVWKGKEDE